MYSQQFLPIGMLSCVGLCFKVNTHFTVCIAPVNMHKVLYTLAISYLDAYFLESWCYQHFT